VCELEISASEVESVPTIVLAITFSSKELLESVIFVGILLPEVSVAIVNICPLLTFIPAALQEFQPKFVISDGVSSLRFQLLFVSRMK
jgi:hypothetical protein